MPDRDARTALYRAFDAAGNLLYIGIAREWGARWAAHAEQSEFYPDVAHIVVEWWPSRAVALRREAHAIQTEHPRWNHLYNSAHTRWHEPRALRCDQCRCWYDEDPRWLWCGSIPFSSPRLVGSPCLDQSGPRTPTGTLPPPCKGRLVEA